MTANKKLVLFGIFIAQFFSLSLFTTQQASAQTPYTATTSSEVSNGELEGVQFEVEGDNTFSNDSRQATEVPGIYTYETVSTVENSGDSVQICGASLEIEGNVAVFQFGKSGTHHKLFLAYSEDGTPAGRYLCLRADDGTNIIAPVEVNVSDGFEESLQNLAEQNLNNSQPESCQDNVEDLGWLLCPILRQLDRAVTGLDRAINNVLQVPDQYIDEDENPRLHTAWERLRNLAYIILVPVLLVMVIGTALGFEFVSAYTVKRALPRLVVATIFIALSFEITKFIVSFSNAIGNGLGGMIMSSFTDGSRSFASITLSDVFAPSLSGDNTALFIGIILAGTGVVLLSIGIVLSYALVAAVGLFIGYTLLVFRQALIIALMILAPLAILSWIFPGNDKLWKLWWGAFWKLLMLYPLVVVLLAAGKSFALVVSDLPSLSSDAAGPDGLGLTLIKISAYVGPYFLIPAAFKYAGGVFSNIAGMVNDRERGLFDRMKKYRGAKMGENWQDFRTGQRYQERGGKVGGAIARGIRRTGVGVGVGMKGNFGFGDKGRVAIDTLQAGVVADVMKSAEYQAQKDNDDILRAAVAGTSYMESVKNLQAMFGYTKKDAELHAKQAQATIGLGRAQQLAAAQGLILTGTGFKGTDGKNGERAMSTLEQMSMVMAHAAGGSEDTAARLGGFANALTKKVGRNDLAPGAGDLIGLIKAQMGPTGSIPLQDRQPLHDAELKATRAEDPVTTLRGKPAAMESHSNTLKRELQESYGVMQSTVKGSEEWKVAADRAKRVIGQINQFDANKSYASPENQQLVNSLVSDTLAVRDSVNTALEIPKDINAPMSEAGKRHLDDIIRYSSRPQYANDPNAAPLQDRADAPGEES